MKHELQENGHPAPEACYAVADALDKAIKKYPNMELNMGCPTVQSHQHHCGTTHCHAGAYFIGAIEIQEGKDYFYSRGSNLMAYNLGFRNEDYLEDWAHENPKIWGSEEGWRMFACDSAFNYAENVSEIAAWWRGVGDRIKEDNLKSSK